MRNARQPPPLTVFYNPPAGWPSQLVVFGRRRRRRALAVLVREEAAYVCEDAAHGPTVACTPAGACMSVCCSPPPGPSPAPAPHCTAAEEVVKGDALWVPRFDHVNDFRVDVGKGDGLGGGHERVRRHAAPEKVDGVQRQIPRALHVEQAEHVADGLPAGQ